MPDPRKQSALIAARRRVWFQTCRTLSIGEEEQRLIVSSHLPPDADPICDPETGELSRNAIFSSTAGFNSAMKHLLSIANNRRARHKSIDGKPARFTVSPAQLSYMRDLGKRLGWAERGMDDLDYRLQTFAARQCGQTGVRLFASLTRADTRKIIEGLKSMLARKQSAQ